MAQARHNYIKESVKRARLEQSTTGMKQDKSETVDSKNKEVGVAGVELDPMAKSLFERLPVPQKMNARHEDGVMSLTAALKGNTTSGQPLIKVTKKNPGENE